VQQGKVRSKFEYKGENEEDVWGRGRRKISRKVRIKKKKTRDTRRRLKIE
jgi:ribosomal protein L31E